MQIRKVCELVRHLVKIIRSCLCFIVLQAMKTMRTDLGAEGRLDILERVMPYRGGSKSSIHISIIIDFATLQATRNRNADR